MLHKEHGWSVVQMKQPTEKQRTFNIFGTKTENTCLILIPLKIGLKLSFGCVVLRKKELFPSTQCYILKCGCSSKIAIV